MEAYALFTDPARARMDELGEGRKAFTRAQTETTSVEIVSAVPLTTDSWQIDWRETTRDHHGQQLGKPQLWRVLIKVLHAPPKTRAQMTQNPLGIYIDEFHWDRMGGN
jgi:type IV secretion system protein VirB5